MDQSWESKANCHGVDVNLFTLGSGEDGVSRRTLLKTADYYCTDCPVKRECLDSCIDDDQYNTLRGGVVPGREEKITVKAEKKDIQLVPGDIERFLARGQCAGKQGPHQLLDEADVTVHVMNSRPKGYRLRCRYCQEEAQARYSAKMGA